VILQFLLSVSSGPSEFLPSTIMTLKLILEANGHRQVLSLDALADPFLQAIQAAVRQEVQRILPSGSTPAPPEEKKSEAVRPLALSKAKAAHALAVSVRTLDYCIAQRKIRVLRIGRRREHRLVAFEVAQVQTIEGEEIRPVRPVDRSQAIKTNIGDSLEVVVHIELRPGRRFIAEVLEINHYDPDADLFDYCVMYTKADQP
jgi:hypothetical protein